MTNHDRKPPCDESDGEPAGRSDDQPIGDALAQHHRGIEEAFAAIVSRAMNNEDHVSFRAAWDAFERELLRHMEIEEKDLFPPFERTHVEEARALRVEHDVIRERLFELGLALDLHQLRAPAVEEFAARLRTHALREDLVLYRWIERNLPQDAWHALGDDLADIEATAKMAASRN
jgi:hemerythrin-like domain-containing protein